MAHACACAVLRAQNNKGVINFAPRSGQYPVEPNADTCSKFTTTLHLITSAIKKLSQLQPAARVFFGKSGANLPEQLETKNALGVRVGVEYGASSLGTSFIMSILRSTYHAEYTSCVCQGKPSRSHTRPLAQRIMCEEQLRSGHSANTVV